MIDNRKHFDFMEVFIIFEVASSFFRVKMFGVLEFVLRACVICAPSYVFKSPSDKLYQKNYQISFFFTSAYL